MPNKGQAGKSISDNGKEKFGDFCNLRICSSCRIYMYVYHVFEFAVFFEYMYTMFYNLLGITVHGSIYLHRGMNKLNKHY